MFPRMSIAGGIRIMSPGSSCSISVIKLSPIPARRPVKAQNRSENGACLNKSEKL